MRHIQCAECGRKTPMGEAFKVFDRTLCEQCADVEVAKFQGREIPEKVVQAEVDPTICAKCGADHGDTELPKAVGVPLCDSCRESVLNYPYPAWIKVSFILLVGLVVFSFVRNFRFFQAYQERQQGIRAFQAGDIETAAKLLTAAAESAPESQDAVLAARIMQGIFLMSQDKCAEALPILRECQRACPADQFIHMMILRAEIGVAFNNKDYDEFLKKAQTLEKLNPNDPMGAGNVASAYACKYAVTGEERFKKDALQYLEKAKRLAGKNVPDLQEYEERIRHRLESREIISHQEYQRRFPKGGEKEAQQK